MLEWFTEEKYIVPAQSLWLSEAHRRLIQSSPLVNQSLPSLPRLIFQRVVDQGLLRVLRLLFPIATCRLLVYRVGTFSESRLVGLSSVAFLESNGFALG